jgi:hypothetical protein
MQAIQEQVDFALSGNIECVMRCDRGLTTGSQVRIKPGFDELPPGVVEIRKRLVQHPDSGTRLQYPRERGAPLLPRG